MTRESDIRLRVVKFAVSRGWDNDDAEDLAQETMIRLYRHSGSIDTRAMQSYALRTAQRLMIDKIRKNRRGKELLLSQDPVETIVDAYEDPESIPSDIALDLQRIVASLDSERQAIVRGVVADRSIQEISDELGLPESTVKTRLFRFRKYINQIYAEVSAMPTFG